MPLTPIDVHNVAFKKPPIGKRGYDEEEVDAFLDEVERELARLLDENVALRALLLPGVGTDPDPDQRLRSEVAALRSRIELALQEKAAAEQAAAEVQSQLEETQAASTARGGGSQGVRVLMMAQRTADDHINNARREAESLVAEAQTKAEQTVQDARGKAAAIEREARERHQQDVDSLEKKRTELLAQINGLAALARDYRNRLRKALTLQLRKMDAVPPDGHGETHLLNAGNLG